MIPHMERTEPAPEKECLKVLVVEDNPVALRLLEKRLADAGYETISANNGKDAIAVFDREFIPIVLTDWMMPQMSGPELCQALRARDLPGYVFIILLTAKSAKHDIIKGLQAGADDYLVKPYDPAELLARLNTARRILSLEQSLKQANAQISRLSVTDPLTGVYNRRYLMATMEKELGRSRRYKRGLSLALCDVDHFKRVNDQHGHRAGDEVLKGLTRMLSSGIRAKVDWMARYGGEEFAIVMPECDLPEATRAMERLRQQVEQTPMVFEKRAIPVTVSMGIASLDVAHAAGVSLDDMLDLADLCLYECKHAGRNRVLGRVAAGED